MGPLVTRGIAPGTATSRRARDARAAGSLPPAEKVAAAAWTVVWIDAETASVARWRDGVETIRVVSDVPVHRRSTGHVRHDAGIRHGGGGAPQSAGEPHRLEHVRRFLDLVAGVIPPDQNVEILGSGTMRYRLTVLLREHDQRQGAGRELLTAAAARFTARQLAARARELNGAVSRRGYRP